MQASDFLEGQVLLIDKPLHWTSFQAVNKLKWAICKAYGLKKLKIGHAGTLDPLATGLLIICTGKFTKKIPQLQNLEKTYTGTITLGATTPSYDLETEINERFPIHHITSELLSETKSQFEGEITQYPPVFSAIKKEGKRLYEFARAGQQVEIPARKVQIHHFNFTDIELPCLDFEVKCSKGTYIRSLANDFGKALDSGGYLSALRRTKIGDYKVEKSLTPEDYIKSYIHL